MARVSSSLAGLVTEGNIVAMSSSTLMQGSRNSLYASFDIGRIFEVNGDNSYILHLYVRDVNSMLYSKPIHLNAITVHHNKLRYIVRDGVVDVNEKIRLDNITVEKIVKICFNGSE